MGEDIINYFPMKEFRPKQKEVLLKCAEKFDEGKKLILLQAPVGFGKSAVNTAICRYYKSSVYTTPQISLIDQIIYDINLGKYFTEIKGRENYSCSKDKFFVSVKYGMCKRNKNFECDRFRECPYYRQKLKAIQSDIAIMSTAYFIVDAFNEPPNFNNRKVVVIDEGHFLSEFVTNQVELEISPKSLPNSVWNKIKDNPKNVENALYEVENFIENLPENMNDEEVRDAVKAEEFITKAKRYIDTEIISEWVWIEKNGGFSAIPISVRHLMPDFIWNRAEKFIVSSATILNQNLWIRENGADLVIENDDIVFIDVGMTFPPSNRKIIDFAVGSMRYDEQKDNIESVVKIIEYIAIMNNGKNIAIHVPSYRLANDIYWYISDEIKSKCYIPMPENRDEILSSWKKNGGIFFAVAYHEGQDWKYDICNVQILAKTLFPDTTDPRIRRRIELNDFEWLNWIALAKCIQAYGRAIRAEDDYMEFYVIDEQFWNLLKRCAKHLPKWFKEVIPKNRSI